MKKYILGLGFLCAVGLFFFQANIQLVSAQVITDSQQLFGTSHGGNPAVTLNGDLPNYITPGTDNNTQIRAIVDIFQKWFKRLMMPVAIIFITWGGVKMILSRGNEEEVFTQRKNETFALATGFLLFIIANVSVDKIFFGYNEEDLTLSGSILRAGEESRIATFGQNAWIQAEGIFDFLTSFIVIISTLYIIVSCVRMLTSFGNEEALSELKNKLLYSILGLAIIISIKQIVYLFTGTRYQYLRNPDTSGMIEFIGQWGNVIFGFLGFIAVVALVWAGIILIAGFGDESRKETAQNIVKYVIIALVLAFSSWTIINYFAFAGTVG